ncbi:phage baseplate assembly protein V [Frigidibacter sp. RF13]|uniref:phage baseplate assembly protein V n=1 Tax=Frigidibacter sp. RF13 TaxID=2997340 RepID=UPI00226F44DE|nr:phage baseplate assembly protein V [Frigidibacter sp. RF13]MCY1125543.1 phage baseplate assembly protein V [Frigidibacter sp. RF13]
MTLALLQLPRLTLTLDGAVLDGALAARLTEVRVTQALGAPAVAELVFADPPGGATSGLMPGAVLIVGLAGAAALFEGKVTAVAAEEAADGLALFRLIARDALHQLARRQSLIALESASAADLARRLAGDIGLAARVDEAAPARHLILQGEQTDLDLLCDIAAEAGLYPTLRDGELRLLSLAGDGEEPVTLARGRNLLAYRADLSGDGWLPGGRHLGRDAVTLDPREAKLSLARQDRVEMRDPGGDLGMGDRVWLNRTSDSAGGAEAELQGGIDRAAAAVAVIEGLAEGDPLLAPGRIARIEGTPGPFAGDYALTRTLHRITAAEGYVTEFSTERPKRPAPARSTSVTIGEVTDVKDPEGLGRCAVTLTDFGAAAAGWMHVVIPGAGARKGLAALPDRGDKVLVLLPDGDPARGYVVGGLYGTERLPKGAEDQPRGLYLRSQDGQVLELKGKDGALRLANRSGSLLDITPRRTRLAAASDMVIEAPGKVITIRADAIKFERG